VNPASGTEHRDLRWGVVVLAAGLGTRMLSTVPKVLHRLGGRPLVDHVLDLAVHATAPDRVVVVVGHGADQVTARIAPRGVRTCLQQPQLGTGDALRVGLGGFAEGSVDAVLVLSGDVPLLRPATLERLMTRLEAGAEAVLLSATLADPAAYGRVVRDADGGVLAIIEARDAGAEILAIAEVNAGVYAFRTPSLTTSLAGLGTDNAQGEYYLTDVVSDLRRRSLPVAAEVLEDPGEMAGVNSRQDLARVGAELNRRVLGRLMESGVTVVDPASTHVDATCSVGPDTVLEPGVVLRGGCIIGAGARIGANAVLDGARIAPGEVVPPLPYRSEP
jgi:bifunctional UDP-N-acetylglucosamine pyrophosphorylase/glucosamine-1-phosphate N-acetyltransferase